MTDTELERDGGNDVLESVPWRRLLSVVGTLLVVALVLPFVVYAVPGVVGADASYVVLSGSMEPAMSAGDVIVAEAVPPSTISAGDVVTFAAAGETRPTTHRVIEVVETEQGLAFRTAGDANEDPDPALVTADQVRGVVPTVGGHLFVIPLVGYVIQFAGTTTGILTLLVAPLVLLVLSEAYVLVRSSRGGDGASGEPGDPEPGASTEPDPVATAGTAAATADRDAEPAEAADEDGGFTLTPMDLRLTVGVLFLFTAYAAWVAYATLEVWAVTGATTVGATLVLVGAMYLFGGSLPEDGTRSGADAPATVPATAARTSERRHEAVHDGGTDRAAVRDAGTPWTGNDGPVLGEPLGGAAPGEAVPGRDGADVVVPRSPTGTAEPAVAEAESAPAPATVVTSDQLEPAIVPVDQATLSSTAADGPVDSYVTAEAVETGRGGPQPPSENPLITVPFVLLYYIGYAVVEPTRFVYRRLSAVRGGGSDD